MGLQLAIDTSTETASVALSNAAEIVSEMSWHVGRNHTTELMVNLTYLLRQTGVGPASIDAVFVARGPGSFNGLRAGVGTAKGLAFSLGVPIIGIGTLEVEAFQHARSALPICPVFDAGRGEIAVALFQQQDGKWLKLSQEHITTAQGLLSEIEGRTIFCGRIPTHIISQIEETLGMRAIIAGGAARLRRAGYLAELGWMRLESGELDDAATLEPLYLRRPVITIKERA